MSDHRPTSFDELMGVDRLKQQAQIAVKAAKAEGKPLDHTLLYGPAGTGKTTIAQILAAEMGAKIHESIGNILRNPSDLCEMLLALQTNDVLFIDEIHAMPRKVQEYLFPAMEDFKFYLRVPEATNPSFTIKLPLFTLIGATTLPHLLDKPMRDRFLLQFPLEQYDDNVMAEIALGMFDKLLEGRWTRAPGTLAPLVGRARGVPRMLKRLMLSVKRWMLACGADVKCIKMLDVYAAMKLEGIDDEGLDLNDRKILRTLYDGGRMGLNALAARTQIAENTIRDVMEPYLLQKGFMERGYGGRWVTDTGIQHVGRSAEYD